MGNEDARFVALQGSRNGESLLAENMGEGVRVAREHPDSGVVVRLAGDDRPWNPGAITGGSLWADKITQAPGADPVEIPLPPEVLAQKVADEAQRQEVEKQAERTAREVAGEDDKQRGPEGQVKAVIDDVIRGWRGKKCRGTANPAGRSGGKGESSGGTAGGVRKPPARPPAADGTRYGPGFESRENTRRRLTRLRLVCSGILPD
ncbi:Multifunctional conjugation protein TraI [Raoultella terrigena]|uniref:Multifunctional conjugation protein TraI n=1 Tax=Raoultella terrigena TaxID=577 RepID=A0A4U9DAF9_RAOTE|nr:Multifunctional conjugation protein TraI [Raoultella terrigena]